MIRRSSGSDFLLITQVDHAALSGFLAAHLGNDLFAAPTAEVIAAIAAHDAGWPLHDDRPTLNAAGIPLHVFETPPSLSTQIWSASVDQAIKISPYSALLVSLHQLNLSDFVIRRSTEAKPGTAGFTPRDVFDLNKFQHRQIELQETFRKQSGLRTDIPLTLGLARPGTNQAEDRLRCDFRWLVLCDSLSLELCCGKPVFPAIPDVLPSPSGKPLQIQIDRVTDETIVLNPWPFNAPIISTDVPFRRLRDRPFLNKEALQAALENAMTEKLCVELRAAKNNLNPRPVSSR